jgi:uridine phosphorylase
MKNNKLTVSELILNKDGSIYHLKLKPEDIATTVITVGDPERVETVSNKFDSIRMKRTCREFVTHTGIFKGKEISVISTGIGTDNVDIVLNELDALVNIDLDKRAIKEKHTSLDIFRIGTSGTIQSNIPIDSLLISNAAVGLDGLLPFYGKGLNSTHAFTSSLHMNFQDQLPPCFYARSSERLKSLFEDDTNFISGTTLTMPGFYAPQGRAIRFEHPIPSMMEKLADFEYLGEKLTNIEMETAGIYGLSNILGHSAISVNAILANRMNGEFSKNAEETVNKAIDLTLEKIISL